MTEEYKLMMTIVPSFDTEEIRRVISGFTNANVGGGPNDTGAGGSGGGGIIPVPGPGPTGREGGADSSSQGGESGPSPSSNTNNTADNTGTSTDSSHSAHSDAWGRIVRALKPHVNDEDEDRDPNQNVRKEEFEKKLLTGSIQAGTQALKSLMQTSLGLVEDIYKKMRDASPLLQAIENLFNLAVRLFFLPLGNKLGEMLIPAVLDLLDKVVEFQGALEGMTFGEAMAYAMKEGTEMFGEFFRGIGESMAEETGIVGGIGRFLIKFGDFIENKLENLLNFMLGFATSVLEHFVDYIALYISLQTALIGAVIGGSGILENLIAPFGAAAGAAAGAAIAGAVGFGVTEAVGHHWMGLAEGGMVQARPGGTAVVLGEGGEDEFVIPRSKLGEIEAQVSETEPVKTPSLFDTRPVETEPVKTPSLFDTRPVETEPVKTPSLFDTRPVETEPVKAPSLFDTRPVETEPVKAPSLFDTRPVETEPVKAPSLFDTRPVETEPVSSSSVLNRKEVHITYNINGLTVPELKQMIDETVNEQISRSRIASSW